MKKIISTVICIVFILAMFTGCSKDETLTLMEREGKIKIGVVYLDETEDILAAKAGFEKGIEESGIKNKVEIQYNDAKGDIASLEKLCSKIFDKNDLVVTIGEEASIYAMSKREDDKKPIFFVGVNNPVTSSLMSNIITPSKNITGVMSKITPDCIFSLAVDKIGTQLRKVGIIYNTSEINPAYEINELKDYLNSNSIKYFEGVIANGFDAQQAALEIASEKLPKLDGSGEMENPKTVYVISGDKVSLESLESISTIIDNVGSIAFVLGKSELPSKNFYSIIPNYKSMGYQCVSLINEYINGVEIAAISAKSSEEYDLLEFVSDETEEVKPSEEVENTQDEQ